MPTKLKKKISPKRKKRAMIFIDNSNVYLAHKNQKKPMLDYPKLVDYFSKKFKLVSPKNLTVCRVVPPDFADLVEYKPPFRALCYLSIGVEITDYSEGEINYKPGTYGFIHYLAKNKIYPHYFVKYGRKEKGVDTALTADLISYCLKNEYDVAIIVASDRDYDYPVLEVMENGKEVIIAYWKDLLKLNSLHHTYSYLLDAFQDKKNFKTKTVQRPEYVYLDDLISQNPEIEYKHNHSE